MEKSSTISCFFFFSSFAKVYPSTDTSSYNRNRISFIEQHTKVHFIFIHDPVYFMLLFFSLFYSSVLLLLVVLHIVRHSGSFVLFLPFLCKRRRFYRFNVQYVESIEFFSWIEPNFLQNLLPSSTMTVTVAYWRYKNRREREKKVNAVQEHNIWGKRRKVECEKQLKYLYMEKCLTSISTIYGFLQFFFLLFHIKVFFCLCCSVLYIYSYMASFSSYFYPMSLNHWLIETYPLVCVPCNWPSYALIEFGDIFVIYWFYRKVIQHEKKTRVLDVRNTYVNEKREIRIVIDRKYYINQL